MLAVSDCKLVRTIKCRAGTEINVAVLIRIQNRIKTCLRRHIDRSRREADILICIIWRIHSQMFSENPVKLIVKTETYCRIRLKLHSLTITVEINSGNYRILKSFEGFPTYD